MFENFSFHNGDLKTVANLCFIYPVYMTHTYFKTVTLQNSLYFDKITF